MHPFMLLPPPRNCLHNIDFLCKMRHIEKSEDHFSICLIDPFQNGADFFEKVNDFCKNPVDFFPRGADYLKKTGRRLGR